MQSMTVRELQSLQASSWKAATEQDDVVVTSDGKPIAVLSTTTADTLEGMLADLRQARALLAVARMQRKARDAGLDRWSLDRVNAEIDAVRRSRT